MYFGFIWIENEQIRSFFAVRKVGETLDVRSNLFNTHRKQRLIITINKNNYT